MTKPENCGLCARGVVIDPEMTYTASGEAHGVSRDTIRRHVLHSVPENSRVVGTGRVVARKTSTKLADGSWDSVTVRYDDVVDAEEAAEAALRISEIVGKVFALPLPEIVSDERTNPFTAMLAPADLQIGKTDINGGTEETLERVRVALAGFIEDIKQTRPAEVIVPDLGDLIENFMNTSAQALTNDRDLIEQVLLGAAIFSEVIREIAVHTPRVVYAAVPSNHSAVRFERGKPSGKPSQDYGLLVQEMVRRELAGRPEYEHVVFVKPRNDWEEFAVYTSDISNTSIGFIHGHQTRGVFKIGEWLEGQVTDRDNPLRDVDILVSGHFHSYTMYYWKTRLIIVTPSADNGSSWFTGLTGHSSPAGLLGMNLINGKAFNAMIY